MLDNAILQPAASYAYRDFFMRAIFSLNLAFGSFLQYFHFFQNAKLGHFATTMKLRIRGNSLRLRLTQGEVSRLMADGRISESVHFSPIAASDAFTYSLKTCENAATVSASYREGEILITLPARKAAEWANTSQVGIEQTQPLQEGTELRIVVEKDFRCLQPRTEEDESDNFPNPEVCYSESP
ncbi:MAG TPA: hypothetical protein VGG46_11175 [Terriglobales bacterium]|jgi:hypothetical protein